MRAGWTALRRWMPQQPSQRLLSSKALGKLPAIQHSHPLVRDFADELSQSQPCFSLRPRDIKILAQPNEFLDELLGMIKRARNRIFLSSLYIGSSEDYLISALEASLKQNPTLHVHLLLDYNRSTRPGPASTASLLAPLVESYPDRVHAYFFKSPKLKGLMAKAVPRRFDEGWGTWHAKIYGVDEEVLISGANLNDSYFTDRQDRYLHFKSSSLSDYCYSFLRAMEPFCFKLSPGLPYSLSWSTQTLHPERIENEAEKALRDFQIKQLQTSVANYKESVDSSNDVLIFPIIQAGQFNIREEEGCVDSLFRHLNRYASVNNEIPRIDFTSGYFSLSKNYQKLIQHSPVDCRVLCASPSANGFLGSSGISGRIPEGYTFLEQRFWWGIKCTGRDWKDGHGVQFNEWKRDGWTYHAKGLWVSPSSGIEGTHQDPVLTLFGSTNLNSRSANLDTELAFVMTVPSSSDEDVKQLRKQLGDEANRLWGNAFPWKGGERKVRASTKALVNVVGGML